MKTWLRFYYTWNPSTHNLFHTPAKLLFGMVFGYNNMLLSFPPRLFVLLGIFLIWSGWVVSVFVVRSRWLLHRVRASNLSLRTMRSSSCQMFVGCLWGVKAERPSSFPSSRWSLETSPSLWELFRLRHLTWSARRCSSRWESPTGFRCMVCNPTGVNGLQWRIKHNEN